MASVSRACFFVSFDIAKPAWMSTQSWILALASSPRFDPNWFAGGRITLGRWRKLLDDPQTPLQNRATQMLYSPGSIFKIVTATAALELGELSAEKTFQCEGTFWIKVWSDQCWNETGSHGWMNVEQALIQSCDIFFYKTGLALNVDRFSQTGRFLRAEALAHV